MPQFENKTWLVFSFKKAGETNIYPTSQKLFFKSIGQSYSWGLGSGHYTIHDNVITLKDNTKPANPITLHFTESEGVYLILSESSIGGNNVYYSHLLFNTAL